MLTTNEAVDGGSGCGTLCRALERRILGAFWRGWVWRGDGFQVAEDGGSLKPYGWWYELLRILNRAGGLCRLAVRRRCLDDMYSRNLNRRLHLCRLRFEKPPSQVDLSPLTQRSEDLRVGRLGISPRWQIRRVSHLLCCTRRAGASQLRPQQCGNFGGVHWWTRRFEGRDDRWGKGGGWIAKQGLERGRLNSWAGQKLGTETHSLLLILAAACLSYHRQGRGYVGTHRCFHYSPLRVSSTPMGDLFSHSNTSNLRQRAPSRRA
jgi:hypothetical protein